MDFVPADVALLRAAAAPLRPLLSSSTADERPTAEAALVEAAADAELVAAIAASNTRLAAVLTRAAAGRFPDKPSRLRRAALAVAAYEARLHGRATPHGLFAGVAGVHFDEGAGSGPGARQVTVRPDQEWLVGVVAALESDPDVLAALTVRTGGVTKRGDRLVTMRRLMPTPDGTLPDQEVSVRRTAAIEALLDFTAQPRPVIDVLGRLTTWHGCDRATGIGVVRDLMAGGLLQTGLLPESSNDDQLGDLIASLHEVGLAEWAKELEEISALARAAEATAGAAREWNELRERMSDVSGATGDQLARLDLGWSGAMRIPRSVADEAAAAATALARTFTFDSSTTVRLREWFLNTHGVDRLVPFRDLLDDHASGPVATLLDDEDASCGETSTERLRMLISLLTETLTTGAREIRVDDRLADFAPPEDSIAAPVVSADLFCRLVSDSSSALSDGDFLLVEPRFGPGPAGATLTRFAPLLPDHVAAVGERVRQARPRMENAAHAEVIFEPTLARSRNVIATPAWLDLKLHTDRTAEDASEIDLDDLLVGATPDGMYLVSKRLGVPIVPVLHSRMNHQLAPAAVRLLLAIGGDDSAQVHGWSWGPLAAAPFLPRVVLGRTVLSPATWRLPNELIATAAGNEDDDTWARLVRAWGAERDLPQRVLVGVAGRRVPLDLMRHPDLLLLRREITSRAIGSVCEFIGDEEEDGWFGDTGRAHVTELVIPMFSTDTTKRRAPQRISRIVHATEATVTEPGSEYLSIECDVPNRSQNIVLSRLREVLDAPLVEAGVDRWFFLRYHRIAYLARPHLRIRFHGPSRALAATLLPAWYDAAEELRAKGLVGDWRITPYDQEVERYGGPGLFADIERLFHADSEAIIHTLRAEQPGLIGTAVLAVSAAELAAHLDPDGTHSRWPTSLHGHPDPALRPEVRALVASGDLSKRLGPEVEAAWARRRELAAAVGRQVRAVEDGEGCWSPPGRIYESIIHLHCNRMAGIAPKIEHQALRLAKDALEYTARVAAPSHA